MNVKSVSLKLFFGLSSLVLPAISFPLKIEVPEGEDHMTWYKVVEQYKAEKKEFEDTVTKEPELYTTAAGRAAIGEMIDHFAQFSEGTAKIAVQRNGRQELLSFARLQNAPTRKDIALQLLEQAVRQCNTDAIVFLAQRYGLNPNDATMTSRTLLDSLGSNQVFDTTPAETFDLLTQKLKLDATKHINRWNIHGETPLHNAAVCLVKNYKGFKNPAFFDKQVSVGVITLPQDASRTEELKKWLAAREEAMKNQRDLIVRYKAHGARDIPNKNGKKPSEILQECAQENGPCKETYEALLKSVVAAATPVAIAGTALAEATTHASPVGYFTSQGTLATASKIVVVAAAVAITGYLCKKLYDKIKES